jgi:CheY-like chemotaxis protein
MASSLDFKLLLNIAANAKRLGNRLRSMRNYCHRREALDFALKIQPDIPFLDINLRGDIDGIGAARLIREQTEIPVVFVTAYGDEATLKRVAAVAPEAPVLQN